MNASCHSRTADWQKRRRNMSDFDDPVGAILGLAFGGLIFLLLGSKLDSITLIDLTFWGVVFVTVAVVLAIAVVVGVLKNLVNGV